MQRHLYIPLPGGKPVNILRFCSGPAAGPAFVGTRMLLANMPMRTVLLGYEDEHGFVLLDVQCILNKQLTKETYAVRHAIIASAIMAWSDHKIIRLPDERAFVRMCEEHATPCVVVCRTSPYCRTTTCPVLYRRSDIARLYPDSAHEHAKCLRVSMIGEHAFQVCNVYE